MGTRARYLWHLGMWQVFNVAHALVHFGYSLIEKGRQMLVQDTCLMVAAETEEGERNLASRLYSSSLCKCSYRSRVGLLKSVANY